MCQLVSVDVGDKGDVRGCEATLKWQRQEKSFKQEDVDRASWLLDDIKTMFFFFLFR